MAHPYSFPVSQVVLGTNDNKTNPSRSGRLKTEMGSTINKLDEKITLDAGASRCITARIVWTRSEDLKHNFYS
jgi:hypothetical protein